MKKKRILLALTLFLIAVVLFSGSALAANPVLGQETAVWELTQTRIIDSGNVIYLDDGILIHDVILEAKARARGGNLVPEGSFR